MIEVQIHPGSLIAEHAEHAHHHNANMAGFGATYVLASHGSITSTALFELMKVQNHAL